MKRIVTALTAGVLLSSMASAYYHIVHFPSATGPYTVVPEKFDLTSLSNNTLRFYVAEQGPNKISGTDSFPALVSQLKLAASAWNSVNTSNLHLEFGGLTTFGTPQVAPGVDVTFDDDVPPGLRAQTFITSWDYSGVTSATFIPILRSRVSLRNDLTAPNDPTQVKTYLYDEGFFLTLVHELGHSFGLQHSLASGVMATEDTRGTTKSKPLSSDDIAGVSVLYPNATFAATTGSIRGTVQATSGATGVNMASVVAISPTGAAVSNLTNPDGTFEIDGIPPGTYYVYVHPLPPAGVNPYPDSIFPPYSSLTSRGAQITTRDIFKTQISPGTFTVMAGQTVNNVNFSVVRQTTIPIYAITTYASVAKLWLKAAPIPSNKSGLLIATGTGVVASDGSPISGVSVSVMGGSQATLTTYGSGYVQVSFNPPFGNGPRHLIFSGNGDQYILPNAFNLYDLSPPNVTSVTTTSDASGNPAAIVSGTNLSTSSRILFDGVVAPIQRANADGSLTVSLPSASTNYQSRVVALNPDGQSSLFVQGVNALQFSYTSGLSGAFASSVSSLAAGVESVIQIDATGTSFVDGQVSVGFGSSDITVRKVFVVSPTRLLVNVGIQSAAPSIATTVTVNSGLQLLSQSASFQILPFVSGSVYITPVVTNTTTGLNSIWAGATGSVTVANLGSVIANATALLNDQPVPTQALSIVNGQLAFTVPSGFPQGTAILKIQLPNGTTSYPVAVKIDAPPPVIQDALAQGSTAIDPNHVVHPGDLITLIVTGIDPASTTPLHVNIGGVDHQPLSTSVDPNGQTIVQLVLAATVSTGPDVPVTVALDSRVSNPFPIAISSN